MNHPDEHTLELYVLGSRKVQPRRRHIESHITGCQRCHDLVQQMSEFYQAVDRANNSSGSTQENHSEALVRRSSTIQAADSPWALPRPPAHPAIKRVYTYVKRHPVVSSLGSLSLLSVAVLLIINGVNRMGRDTNPDHVQYGAREGVLSILNSRGEKLWDKPTLMVADDYRRNEEANGCRFAVVADLNEDHRNEVISVLPFRGLDSEGALGQVVRILGPTGEVRKSTPIGRAVRFGAKEDLANYRSSGILARGGPNGRVKNVLAGGANLWSPSVIMSLSPGGSIEGEYWHYGHAGPMYLLKSFGPQHADYLLLLAKNDARDTVGADFAAVVVLDPNRIQGVTESSATRGFGFEQSSAEIYYVRLPQPDVGPALGKGLGPLRLSGDDEQSFACFFGPSSGEYSLEFTFGKDMTMKSIKPAVGYEALHAKLLQERKIHKQLESDYFERLKTEVRYWDGRGWKTEVTKVHR
jgi:hypothetical protein